MLIARSAIKRFLARPRKDYRFYKRLSERELDARIAKLPVTPPIYRRFNKDQKLCFLIGAETSRFCFWADTGTGKTFLSIGLARYFRKLGTMRRAIVLVPSKINKAEWAREIRKWSPNTSFTVLTGSSENKWRQLLESDSTLVIETYGGLVRMLTELVKVKRKKKKALALDGKKMKTFLAQIQGIFMDESINVAHKKGRHGSLMHRICRKIADNGAVAFALNGTPHGRDPTDMWGQFRIVDGGYTLGETLGLFRAAFCTERELFWGGVEYKFDKKKAALLNKIIAHKSIRIEADESALPQLVRRQKKISLGADAQEIYKRAKETLIAAHGNYMEMKNAFLRMRQISSGFVGYYDDEQGTKAQYFFARNPKLETLCALIEEVHLDHKIVVYHDFIISGDIIARELKKMGIGYVRLHGHKGTPDDVLHKFDNDDKVRVFILNNFESSGLNLQIASYGIYYESPLGIIKRKQSTRRIERQHSKHKRVFIYDLVVEGTVDERILEMHAEGKDLYEMVIEGRDPKALRRLAT